MNKKTTLWAMTSLLLFLASCDSGTELFCDSWTATPVGADGCTVTYSQCTDGSTYEVNCSVLGTQSFCNCVENTVQVGTFTSAGFCSLSGAPQKDAANTGCDWVIDG